MTSPHRLALVALTAALLSVGSAREPAVVEIPNRRSGDERSTTTSAALPRRMVIGRSTEGRKIVAVRDGARETRHTVLVVGIIHGDEKAGRQVVRVLRHRWIPRRITLWTIWRINPDGAQANTRQNGRGVDLNRNFPRHWRRMGERWDTFYSGPRPLSEPETRAARRFILDIRPDVTIWYHQALRMIVRTGGPRRDRRIQARYARRVGLPLRRLGFIPGTATRWQDHRFPHATAFVVELPGGPLSRRSAGRHARAVIEVARM